MIPKDCKRLAEVDFPIAAVSVHAPREKGIPQGHPSRMHLWWARRPLASSRAVLLGLLWPDPCDSLCPTRFKAEARRRLREVGGCDPGSTDEDLQKALLQFIGSFAAWDHGTNRTFLDVSRALVKAAHGQSNDDTEYESPLVVDSFAGGGSIPLEALRLNCQTFASDLNPVACMILKVMLEDIPRQGLGWPEQLELAGANIKQQADNELAEVYPKDSDGAKPIAYIWARTVRCEAPNCGAEIPLIRSLWLCKKTSRKRALRLRVERAQNTTPRVAFELFEPNHDHEVSSGTVARAKATCICCSAVLSPERVRAQLHAQRGGADVVFDAKWRRLGGAQLLAVVTLHSGEIGRHYRLPTENDYESVQKAQARINTMLAAWEHAGSNGMCPVPDEPLPPIGTLGFRVQRYGMLKWGDLFTARQKLSLTVVADAVRKSNQPALVLALGKLADLSTSGCLWHTKNECPNQVLTTARVKPFWDFAEGVPTSGSSGSIEVCIEKLIGGICSAYVGSNAGNVTSAAAQAIPLPDEAADIWFVDPPYYDAVPYADLSDLFFVWFKRALPGNTLLRDPLDSENPLSPKRQEAVQDETRKNEGRTKDRGWFEETMALAFAEGRRVLRENGIGAVVFAHKSTEGWEALLSGMIRGRWTITGSWPIATEMTTRLRARESAALATSVHLICRPRPDDAAVGDWADVLRELPTRVASWIDRLQNENVRGADLVFACIGPALEIFSRYRRVETADGHEVKLDEYLAKVWEVVGRSALAQVLGTSNGKEDNESVGAIEEDARLTALFLWTLQSTEGEVVQAKSNEPDDDDESSDEDDDNDGSSRGKAKGFTLVFDVVRRFAQPLGIELPKWEGRVVETKKGVVRLLPIAERALQLFGDQGAQAVAFRLEQEVAPGSNPLQGLLFPEIVMLPKIRGRTRAGSNVTENQSSADSLASARRQATTLDRVHAAMLLQAGGRTNALRALLKAEQERSSEFLRLANALSALYPKGSEEKRLIDAMLLSIRR
jgi:putative DNA methylase